MWLPARLHDCGVVVLATPACQSPVHDSPPAQVTVAKSIRMGNSRPRGRAAAASLGRWGVRPGQRSAAAARVPPCPAKPGLLWPRSAHQILPHQNFPRLEVQQGAGLPQAPAVVARGVVADSTMDGSVRMLADGPATAVPTSCRVVHMEVQAFNTCKCGPPARSWSAVRAPPCAAAAGWHFVFAVREGVGGTCCPGPGV